MNLATALKLGQLYLKTVDRTKVTTESVVELVSLLGRTISESEAATVANAIRTRGQPDAMSLAIIAKVAASKSETATKVKEMVVKCEHCGTLKVVQFNPDEVPDVTQ